MPDSIRWRLPLSYAAVALLAVVTLGAVLLLLLGGYYRRQEALYLTRNAETMGGVVEILLSSDDDPGARLEIVRATLESYAYLSQTEVRLENATGELLFSTGNPRDLQAVATISLEVAVDGRQQTIGQRLNAASASSFVIVERPGRRFESEATIAPAGNEPPGVPLLPSGWVEMNDASARSALVVAFPLRAPDGSALGRLLLSNGPGFGQAVLRSVTLALGAAALAATLPAAGAGWLASRRLAQPISSLAATAGEMASGNLKVRSGVRRGDEIGVLAEAFNGMAAQVERTILTLRHFVADAAHELHTPLTALRTELALADAPPAAQEQVERLAQLTAGLLDLSRLESGAGEGEKRPVDLNELLRARSEIAAARAEQAGLDFALELPETFLMVLGRREQLARVIDNLLDNAVKFTPAGGFVEVTLDHRHDRATLTIRDTGIGVDPRDLDGLFQRFHRGRNAANYPGSGLGLVIVQQIVRAHGGTVALTGADRGTLATVCLPRLV
jgi:signal transduction histidine kinase